MPSSTSSLRPGCDLIWEKGASADIIKYLGRIILGYPDGPIAIKFLCEEQVKRPGEGRGQGEEGL